VDPLLDRVVCRRKLFSHIFLISGGRFKGSQILKKIDRVGYFCRDGKNRGPDDFLCTKKIKGGNQAE
jgi:hypothetical protein